MTARTSVWPLFALTVCLSACEEKSAPAPEGTDAKPAEQAKQEAQKAAEQAPAVPVPPPAAPKEVSLPGPAEVCPQLIDAAKAKEDTKVLSLSTPATQTALAADAAKEHVLTTLAAATCGAVKIEGDSASVALVGTKPAQEATFTKSADGWRFDGAAFLAKYPVQVVKEKAKKAATKAHQKAKAAHEKKHH